MTTEQQASPGRDPLEPSASAAGGTTAPGRPTPAPTAPGASHGWTVRDEGWTLEEVPPDADGSDAVDELLQAMLAIAGDLELPTVLDRFVRISVELTGARFGAINVLDSRGESTTFVQSGVPTVVARAMGHPPHAAGVLSRIPAHGVLLLEDLRQHPAFQGFPAQHPPMGSFLGAAVRIRDEVYGYLYLSEKDGGFTDEDATTVEALAAAAGVAISNAQLYADSARREHWLRAGQEITTMLLQGADEEDVLAHIAATARTVSHADSCALVLPGLRGELMVEIADGYHADRLVGLVMPADGRSARVMQDGHGILVDSLSRERRVRVPALRDYGPALYAPLHSSGRAVGVLILMRRVGRASFGPGDLDTAESFAGQAALAFVLAEARHAQDMATMIEERERIARDLHDLAIQQLFATGMQLESLRRRGTEDVAADELTTIVESALDNVDGSVRQIRQIVHALRDPDAASGIVERLRREASLARTGLGFAPSLVVALDGHVLDDGDDDERVDARLSPELCDDVVAVVREGMANAARHAQATSVTVRVEVRGAGSRGTVRVEVLDDGVGLPDDRHRSSGTGNLAARARQHRGTFTLGLSPTGRGTLLAWHAPLV